MIRKSGARSVLDLLEMYVPNMHYLPHHWEPRHIGIRGIIGDREDKYLLLVNGKVMNEKTHLGAMSERDLPMLGDIRVDQKLDSDSASLCGVCIFQFSMDVSRGCIHSTTFGESMAPYW